MTAVASGWIGDVALTSLFVEFVFQVFEAERPPVMGGRSVVIGERRSAITTFMARTSGIRERHPTRPLLRAIERAFSPLTSMGPDTWGVAPGWYRTRLQRLLRGLSIPSGANELALVICIPAMLLG